MAVKIYIFSSEYERLIHKFPYFTSSSITVVILYTDGQQMKQK